MNNEARDVIHELRKNSILLKRAFCKRHQKPTDNFGGQGHLLHMLRDNPGMSQKALAEIAHIRPQSLGETIGKLESAGLVIKKQNDFDKRVTNIFLTDNGISECAKIDAKSDAKIEAGFKDLTDEEIRLLFQLVKKLNNSIENNIDPSEMASEDEVRMSPPRHTAHE